jgi:glycosyltransferase involved in cell wall biosynthesis
MRLLILTRYDRLGASSRLRMLQYVEHLEAGGIQCTISPLLPAAYVERLYATGRRSILALVADYLRRARILFRVGDYDQVWIEKELFPSAPATAERLLARLGVPYVVDYDDAVFHSYDRSRSFVKRLLLGGKIDVVMAKARTVIAGNAYIAERARAAGASDVRIVPTVVDHRSYRRRPPAESGRLTIGWIGSPATQHFLALVAAPLVEVCRRHNARLLLVGAQPSVARWFDGIDVEIRRWSEDSERDDVAEMDIGIMPLEDGPWERGKCGYKLIQYMAGGVAVCASPVGVNVDIVSNSRSGLLASTDEEWTQALELLAANGVMRREMQDNGLEAVRRHYSVESQLPAILAAITGQREEGAS